MTPFLTLESNEYESYMLEFASNVIQKLCDLLGGRGGGHQKITLDHRGEGGRSRWAKKGSHNFLTLPKSTREASKIKQAGGAGAYIGRNSLPPKIFLNKKSQYIKLSAKKLLTIKDCGPKKILCFKMFCSKKVWVSKIRVPQKFFGSKKILGPKYVGSETILCQKH